MCGRRQGRWLWAAWSRGWGKCVRGACHGGNDLLAHTHGAELVGHCTDWGWPNCTPGSGQQRFLIATLIPCRALEQDIEKSLSEESSMEAPSGTSGGPVGSPQRSRGPPAQKRVEKGQSLWRRRWAMLGERKGCWMCWDQVHLDPLELLVSSGELDLNRPICLVVGNITWSVQPGGDGQETLLWCTTSRL